MKKKSGIICLILSFIFLCSISFNFVYADEMVYLGGMPAGFSLNSKGCCVVGVSDIITEKGLVSPAKDCDINIGDKIISIDGEEVNNGEQIEKAIKGKTEVLLLVQRDKEKLFKNLTVVKDMSGHFKLGIFVRNNICGIGTITYIRGNRFGSLGHPVLNEDGTILEIIGGELYNCNISGCEKGKRGKAGELKGTFLRTEQIASIDKNLDNGVYGYINNKFRKKNLKRISVGSAEIGEAKIYSTIDGSQPKEYSIQIVKTENFSKNKNFVLKITDEELILKTSGIVQGMSGSPIIQNNKLVGAVTHVFINDPSRGFGISIDNMINN